MERAGTHLGVVVSLQGEVQVELVLDELAEEASEVTLGKPVLQVRGERVSLTEAVMTEVGLRRLGYESPKVSDAILPPIGIPSARGRRCARGS